MITEIINKRKKEQDEETNQGKKKRGKYFTRRPKKLARKLDERTIFFLIDKDQNQVRYFYYIIKNYVMVKSSIGIDY